MHAVITVNKKLKCSNQKDSKSMPRKESRNHSKNLMQTVAYKSIGSSGSAKGKGRM